MNPIAILSVVWTLAFLPCIVTAASGPVDFTRNALEDLSIRPKENVAARVRHYYDFGALFDRATQDFQAALTQDETSRLRALFIDVVTKKMNRKLERLVGKDMKKTRYALKAQQGAEFTVSVLGTAGQRPVKLEFTVTLEAGAYKIVDLSVAGALLSRNYRGQFNRIFRLEGAVGLEKRMRAQLRGHTS